MRLREMVCDGGKSKTNYSLLISSLLVFGRSQKGRDLSTLDWSWWKFENFEFLHACSFLDSEAVYCSAHFRSRENWSIAEIKNIQLARSDSVPRKVKLGGEYSFRQETFKISENSASPGFAFSAFD